MTAERVMTSVWCQVIATALWVTAFALLAADAKEHGFWALLIGAAAATWTVCMVVRRQARRLLDMMNPQPARGAGPRTVSRRRRDPD